MSFKLILMKSLYFVIFGAKNKLIDINKMFSVLGTILISSKIL